MARFLLSERYRLELHWEKVKYTRNDTCELIGAYLSGPVLSNAEKINSNDSIKLDFFKQYIIFVKDVYVGELSWTEVIYRDKIVILKDAKITHDSESNKIPKFGDTDYLVIDTANHEMAVHMFNLLYTTYVLNKEGEPYNFRS
jgi:hypothetical protein